MNIGKTGIKGEKIAAKTLTRKGYKIIETNYVSPFGEIDIIAENGDTLVFAEVKTRGEGYITSGVSSVNRAKRRRICRTAALYSEANGHNLYKRFDIIEVYIGEGGKHTVNHIENAFPYE